MKRYLFLTLAVLLCTLSASAYDFWWMASPMRKIMEAKVCMSLLVVLIQETSSYQSMSLTVIDYILSPQSAGVLLWVGAT